MRETGLDLGQSLEFTFTVHLEMMSTLERSVGTTAKHEINVEHWSSWYLVIILF